MRLATGKRMFAKHRGVVCGVVAPTLLVGIASAEEKPIAVLELGGASAWNVPGSRSFGPTAAVEFEPIKDRLLIEAGTTPFFDDSGHADWDFDVLFRHPRPDHVAIRFKQNGRQRKLKVGTFASAAITGEYTV